MVNSSVEMQREVLTPFLINRDYLGCHSETSAEYRSEWGSHVVDSLLELCYIQSGESFDRDQDFIPSLWRDFSQFLTFYVKTDWYTKRTGFSVHWDDSEETSLTSELLFTPTSDGHWRSPGERNNYSNIIFSMTTPGQDEYYQRQVSTLIQEQSSTLIEGADEDTFEVPYLPRYCFDMLIKFLLRWLMESLRVKLVRNGSDVSLVYGDDESFTRWVSPVLSVGWTLKEFKEVRHLLMCFTELTHSQKNHLLRLFQFSDHSGISYQVIPKIQQYSAQSFSFTENRNESNDQTQSDTQESELAEENMEKIMDNLSKIEAWIDFNSPPPVFKTNTAFMKFAVEIMNRCLSLLRTGVAASPDAETARRGYTKHRAIIVGHMVRLTKLYEGVLIHVCSHHQELAHIFLSNIRDLNEGGVPHDIKNQEKILSKFHIHFLQTRKRYTSGFEK